jgi:hypothetical protein
MCTDGVSMLIFENEAIMEKMSNPILDFVHKQVVMTLYSLEAAKRLDEYRELLPTYLSKDWPECEAILSAIEQAGLVTLRSDGITLTHRVESDNKASCGCH